jgi:hypothetical protein
VCSLTDRTMALRSSEDQRASFSVLALAALTPLAADRSGLRERSAPHGKL